MTDDDSSIRTTCELEVSLLLKLALWDHEPWLLSFVGHLFSSHPTRFVRMRLDRLIVTRHSYGRWATLGGPSIPKPRQEDQARRRRVRRPDGKAGESAMAKLTLQLMGRRLNSQ